jgi:HD-GYP domain-containing protein (c-di-GMP phosphodiesterase class II)
MADILQQSLGAGEVLNNPGQDGEEGFLPLAVRNMTVGREVSFDVHLKLNKQEGTEPQFVKCVTRGGIFQKELYQKLIRLQILNIYVSLKETTRVMQYLQHHLKLVLGSNTQSGLEKGMQLCDATQMWALNFFNHEKARSSEEIKLAQQFLEPLLAVIKGERQNLMHLMRIKRHKGFRLYSHCLNVCLLGMAYTSYLGWSQEKILGFGLGALLHDIGLTRTPQVILNKQEKLTAEEMSQVKRHPLDGYRMMQAFVHLRVDALQMVLQHHENGDGSGYPQGLKLQALHSWARILRILDSYEAMTAARPWRPAMEPKEALWTMRSDWEKSKLFDHGFLKSFVRFLAGG